MIQPPGNISHSKLKIAVLNQGTKLFRISLASHPTPLFFNTKQTGRFNSPAGEYGVCYAADSVDAAFAESFGHSVTTRFAPNQSKIIAESDLDANHVYEIEVIDLLHLGELCGSGLPRLNLDNSINTSPKPYSLPQQWSKWVYNHGNNLDGIRYHSRHLPNNRGEALFGRCYPKLAVRDMGSLSHWSCPKSGKDIWDLLTDHGWSTYH